MVGIGCCFRWSHRPRLDGKHIGLTLRTNQKECPPWEELGGFNCSGKPNTIEYNTQHESAQHRNRRVNDQLGLVPLYVFIGSGKHRQMPHSIILDKGCLMNYTKALAEDKPNAFFSSFFFFFILFSTERECDYATSLPGKLCSLSSSSVKWHYLICDSWLKCFSVVL